MAVARFPFRSLRDWFAFLEEKGDIVHNKEEVDIWGDVAAISGKIARTDGPAVIHENIKGFPTWRLCTDGLATRRRQLWALNAPEDGYLQAINQRLSQNKPLKPVKVDSGPCKEVKLFGDDIDLIKIPTPFTGEFLSTPHITAGISFIKDPETGWTNAAIRRFQIIARDTLCNLVLPYQHEGIIFIKYKRQGKPAPIAIPIGVDPVAYICCMMPAPTQFDEMDIWGQLTGEPLEVVKCETSDILVPATAEIVIEGEMDHEQVELEGPLAEFPGYASGFRMCPVIKVKAITMRGDAIAQAMFMGKPPSEGHNAGMLMNEIQIYQQLKSIVPEVTDVAILSTHVLTGAIAIDKRARRMRPGLEKRVAMAAKVVSGLLKNVFLVDDDVNPHDVQDVLWSLSVKFQGAKDIMVIPDVSGVYLDPSETVMGPGYGYTGHSSYTVFDCTEKLPPYDEGFKRGLILPPPEAVKRVEEKWKSYGF
jgi:UbiD family decarboxylase